MAKAVHWQIPFQSRLGTNYRIDIYDEGYSGNPVRLTGAADVFTTEEDNSDDFFEAVRAQTGHISFVNEGLNLLEELMPQTALDRPVRLVNLSQSNKIEWQGFLAVDVYSQQYVSYPQTLSIPVVSSLQVMESLELLPNASMQLASILKHLIYAFYSLGSQVGISNWFSNIYLPTRYYASMSECTLYQNFCLNSEDVFNQSNIVVEAHSVSCAEIVKMIAGFFGCVVREAGANIYMTDIINDGTRRYQYATYAEFVAALIQYDYTPDVSTLNISTDTAMSSLTWTGNGHRKSIRQGARRVKLGARLKNFECDMSLPPIPYGSLVEGDLDLRVYANTNDQSYSLATYKYIHAQIVCPADPNYPLDPTTTPFVLSKVAMLTSSPYAHTLPFEQNNWSRYYLDIEDGLSSQVTSQLYLCAYLSIWKDSSGNEHNGLRVCGFPQKIYGRATGQGTTGRALDKSGLPLVESEALYTQQTILPFGAAYGWFHIDAKIPMFRGATTDYPTYPMYNAGSSEATFRKPGITMSFKYGNQYWNGSGWTNSFTTFVLPFDTEGNVVTNKQAYYDTDEDSGYFMSVPSAFENGLITVKIYHEMCGMINVQSYFDQVVDVFLEKLDIEYIAPNSIVRSDSNENMYTQDTNANFKNVEERTLDLATDMYNDPRANMLYYEDTGVTIKLLTLDGTEVRPEEDLLNRMTSYFAEARCKIILQAQHPANLVLPTAQMDGFDSKTYLPLSESREWAKDTAELTCYETVNNE